MAVFEYFKYILNTIHLRKANSPYITAASDKLQLLALPTKIFLYRLSYFILYNVTN